MTYTNVIVKKWTRFTSQNKKNEKQQQHLHPKSNSYQAASPEDAEAGMVFMQDMIDLSKQQAAEGKSSVFITCL